MLRSTLCIVALGLALLAAPALATEPLPESIGRATMEADGSLTLFLIAHAPGGITGHSLRTYQPSDPDYKMILDHIGPISPGQTVSVPPWPDPPEKK